MIKLQDVSYYYSGAACPAIDSVSLTIEQGEFIAVMGRNASGKSTLARLLNGLLTPRGGQVTVDGLDTRDRNAVKSIRKKVGLLFPDPDDQIISNLVEEDVAFGPENIGLSSQQIRYRVDTALAKVSMEDFAKYPPYLLSGGQKQRVCIAGILAVQPQYMVLDEPAAMLDPHGRKQVMETLCKLNREEGMALVWLTHSLEEASRADRIIILEQGRIVLQGSPREIISRGSGLYAYGIEPLALTSLIEQLNRSGIDLSAEIVSTAAVVDELCRLV